MGRSRIAVLIAHVIGIIPIAFGINALVNPESALAFLPLESTTIPLAKDTINALLYLYGIRDIFWGVSIQAAALFGGPRVLGLSLLAGAGVAIADGYVIKGAIPGEGHEWNHWGYSPLLFLPGLYLLL